MLFHASPLFARLVVLERQNQAAEMRLAASVRPRLEIGSALRQTAALVRDRLARPRPAPACATCPVTC